MQESTSYTLDDTYRLSVLRWRHMTGWSEKRPEKLTPTHTGALSGIETQLYGLNTSLTISTEARHALCLCNIMSSTLILNDVGYLS